MKKQRTAAVLAALLFSVGFALAVAEKSSGAAKLEVTYYYLPG